MIFLEKPKLLSVVVHSIKSTVGIFLALAFLGLIVFTFNHLPGDINASSLSNALQDAASVDFGVSASGNSANGQTVIPIAATNLDVIIHARAALSLQIDDGQKTVDFALNEDKKLPIASLAKLMTAMVVLERYDLNQKITISKAAMAQEGEQGELKEGQQFLVRDLLYITLIESSNRSAYALAEAVGVDHFIDLMNEGARNLGLANTHFEDSTGLDANSYSSARDLATLSQYLFEIYPLFSQIIAQKETNVYLANGVFHHKLVNTNKLLGQVPGLIGGKTGWTDDARGCFMIIKKNEQGNVIINVVLGAEDRFLEMNKLIAHYNQ